VLKMVVEVEVEVHVLALVEVPVAGGCSKVWVVQQEPPRELRQEP